MSLFRQINVILIAIIVLSLAGLPAAAQDADSSGYVRIFDLFLVHTQALQWDSVAELMHPEGLDHIKEIMLSAYDGLVSAGQPTDDFLRIFGAIESGDQLREMPSNHFFISMMNAILRLPGFREMISGAETTIIGTVAENDTLVHAVYRTNIEYEGALITDVEVATARRFGSTWRMALSSEIEQFAEMFKQF